MSGFQSVNAFSTTTPDPHPYYGPSSGRGGSWLEETSDEENGGAKTPQERSMIEEPDESFLVEQDTNYSLFNNPPDLAQTRQKLFEVKEDIDVSEAELSFYFVWVDNVWHRKKRTDPPEGDSSPSYEIWNCKLKQDGPLKSHKPKPHVEGRQIRRKRKREEKTCAMSVKVTFLPNKRCKISRLPGGEHIEHSHDLDFMDSLKRNSSIMDVARREANRGFLPGSVFWKMNEEEDKMREAGGTHMKLSDVRNVQYAWRQSNLNLVLKAHAGYNQTRAASRPKLNGTTSATSINGTPNKTSRTTKPASAVKPRTQTYGPPPQQPYQSPYDTPVYAQHRSPSPVPPPLPAPQPKKAITLQYPEYAKDFLRPYLPISRPPHPQKPYITLTWASSLDSRIALSPATQTQISSPETKAMTHFLRSQHDAILIGSGTVLSDDPSLNCRLSGAGGFGEREGEDKYKWQPRPVIIDPHGRVKFGLETKLLKTVREGRGRAPWVLLGPGVDKVYEETKLLIDHGGKFIRLREPALRPDGSQRFDWGYVFSEVLFKEGIRSVMVEGGGKVLSDLLDDRWMAGGLVDTAIITIAPTFFGRSGVEVCADTATKADGHDNHERPRRMPVQQRLTEVHWQPIGAEDVVVCGRVGTRFALPGNGSRNTIALENGHGDGNGTLIER